MAETFRVITSVKLWLLELNPPVCGYDAYEACKALYAKRNETQSSERLTSAISDIMSRLSGVQILILDTLFAHLQTLVQNTRTEEADEVFITKLALSLGRGEILSSSTPRVRHDYADRNPSCSSYPTTRNGICGNAARPHPFPSFYRPIHAPTTNLCSAGRTRATGDRSTYAREKTNTTGRSADLEDAVE